MNILINALTIDKGGRLTYFQELIPSLSKLAKEDKIYYLHYKEHLPIFSKLSNIYPISVSLPSKPKPLRVLWEQVYIPKIVKQNSIDVIYFPSPLTSLFPGAPFVLDMRDPNIIAPLPSQSIGFRLRNKIAAWFATKLSKRAGKILFVSEFSRIKAIERFDLKKEKTFVQYHHINFNHFAPDHIRSSQENRLAKKKYLLTVSTIQEHKNYLRALIAFRDLIESGDVDCDYVIIGSVSSQRQYKLMRSYINKYGLHKNVHLLGHVPYDILPEYYQNAICYFAPSLLETFGIPIIEAIASGTPVAASKNSAIPEIAGDQAHYFDPYNTNDMSKILLKIIKSKKELNSQIQSRIKLVEKYALPQNAIPLYNALVEITRNK